MDEAKFAQSAANLKSPKRANSKSPRQSKSLPRYSNSPLPQRESHDEEMSDNSESKVFNISENGIKVPATENSDDDN